MNSIDCQPSIHWEFPGSSAEGKEKGMVVLYPSTGDEDSLSQKRFQALIQELQKTYQVVIGALSPGTDLDVQEGRKLLQDRGIERVSATLFFHGTSSMIGLGQEKCYRREDVRAEHFEGLDALYFVACQAGMETDGLAGRTAQSLAGRIAQVAKIVVWAPVDIVDPEKAVFYTGSEYHGPVSFDAEGRNIYRIFSPSGIWVSPSSLDVSRVVGEMRKRVLESKESPDLMATRFLTAHYCDCQRLWDAKLWAELTLDRFTIEADESGYCQHVVGWVFEYEEQRPDRAYPYHRQSALFGYRPSLLKMIEILIERKEYEEAAHYFDMLGKTPKYSSSDAIRAKYAKALDTLSYNMPLANSRFYDCILQVCCLEKKEVIKDKLFPILCKSVESLQRLSREGDPAASHYLATLFSHNSPLLKWRQELNLFQTDEDRLKVVRQYLRLSKSLVRKQGRCGLL